MSSPWPVEVWKTLRDGHNLTQLLHRLILQGVEALRLNCGPDILFVLYQNSFHQTRIGLSQILRWKLGLGPREVKHPVLAGLQKTRTPVVPPDLKAIHEPDPSRIQLTWIGHSSFLIQHRNRNVLTDPIFGHAVSPVPGIRVRRMVRPGLTMINCRPFTMS